jgi:hypothetical protein
VTRLASALGIFLSLVVAAARAAVDGVSPAPVVRGSTN